MRYELASELLEPLVNTGWDLIDMNMRKKMVDSRSHLADNVRYLQSLFSLLRLSHLLEKTEAETYWREFESFAAGLTEGKHGFNCLMV